MHYTPDAEKVVSLGLIGYLSSIFENRVIIDLNKESFVHGSNTITVLENLLNSPLEEIMAAAFIILNKASQTMETYEYLKKIGYRGLVVCKGIWSLKEMRDTFWYQIPYAERYDGTDFGDSSGTGIISFSSDITFDKRDNSNWTLVTAYFDLTKCPDASVEINKRGAGHYLSHAVSTMTLPYNLVVYCEQESVEALKALRPAYLADKTRYVVSTFDEFQIMDRTFAEYRTKIKQNRVDHPYHFDNRNTPSYYLFCMSRYIMLKETIDANTFGSTHFAWINICIERMGISNVQRLDEALAVKRDRFSTCYIDYIPESMINNKPEYFKWGRCSMCSGFFTGNAEYMWKVCDKILQKFVEYVEVGYGHADEQLFSPVYFQNKDLFEHYYGDYQQMITNYASIYEAAEPPIYNFVRNSFKHGDYDKCREACEFVSRSIKAGKCACDPKFLNELRDYESRLKAMTGEKIVSRVFF